MSNCTCQDGSCSTNQHAPHTEEHGMREYLPAAASLAMLGIGIVLNQTEVGWFARWWVNLLWFVLAYIPVGLPVLQEAWHSLREGEVFNEFMLMGIATLGAFYIGQYPEAVAVMLFYAVGELFQHHAVDKAKRNIAALLDARPDTANVVRQGKVEVVPPQQVQVGQTIEVKVGERVPLDGVMESDSAALNTAALTGESVPRTLHRGDEVLAGMIVTDRLTRIQVTRPYEQSALARILQLVQEATERKAPAEQFIRKFAKVYTPIVVGLAVLIVGLPWLYSLLGSYLYVFNEWLYRGLVFLVISCPCALVISIPLGYFGGIGLASRHGILFKGSNYLHAITTINTVVMDKTGTLTQGVFAVQQVVPNSIAPHLLLATMAAVEQQSTHPIAKAIVQYATAQGLQWGKPTELHEIPGYGLHTWLDQQEVLVGSPRLLDQYGVAYPAAIDHIPETTVVCAINGCYAGYVVVADTPKEDAAQAISELKKQGIHHVVMLSGDKQAIVSKVADTLGIAEAYGNLLPEHKVQHVERLKANPANRIAFVGDGINDAPVLATSHVGIAMGGLGSDVAIETADVVIQTDKPSKVATAIQIGKLTRRIITQNIALAFGVKMAVLILGAGGLATLWEAVFADVGVALLAILNATRLLRMKLK